jgi:hypothetical protein
MIETQSTVELSYQQKEPSDIKMQPITNETPIEENCAEHERSQDKTEHENPQFLN